MTMAWERAVRAVGENAWVAVVVEVLDEIALDAVDMVVANDAARSTFTVGAGDCLLALDTELRVVGRWPHQPRRRGGLDATLPGRGLALISGQHEVRLVDQAGRLLWRYQHPSWTPSLGRGCAWFDQAGQPHAIINLPSETVAARLDLDTGQLLARAPAGPAAGPIHHPDGWIGLGEISDSASSATWVRSAHRPPALAELHALKAGWHDSLLRDVDPSGTKIITTPHNGAGPLTIREFPSLEILQVIDRPGRDALWDHTACFAGDMIIAMVTGQHERLAAITGDGALHDLGERDGWLIPASGGTWLLANRTTIHRCRLKPA